MQNQNDKSQAPIATPSDHDVKQGGQDAALWTPHRLAKAESGVGFPIPSNPAVLMYPGVAAESSQHHYNVDAMNASPTYGRTPPVITHNSPIIVGGVNLSFDSASPPTHGQMRTGPSSGSSEWQDPSLGNSGFKPNMSQEYGEIIPLSLDFSPEKTMEHESQSVNPSTATPASSPTVVKKRELAPAAASPDESVGAGTSYRSRKKAKVQDWLNKTFGVYVTCDLSNGGVEGHRDVSGESAGSSSHVRVQASSGGNRTIVDFFNKKK